MLVSTEFFDFTMEDIRIEIIVENTAEDYRRVIVQLYRNAWILAGVLYLLIIPPMLWLTMFGAGGNPFDEKNHSDILLMGLFALLPIGMAIGIVFATSRKANRAASKAERSVFIFDKEAMEVKASSYSSRVGWNMFAKVRELKEDFIFYRSETVFFAIPKNSFNNESQITEFRNLIRETMGKNAKLKN